jgi:hypothetical protein
MCAIGFTDVLLLPTWCGPPLRRLLGHKLHVFAAALSTSMYPNVCVAPLAVLRLLLGHGLHVVPGRPRQHHARRRLAGRLPVCSKCVSSSRCFRRWRSNPGKTCLHSSPHLLASSGMSRLGTPVLGLFLDSMDEGPWCSCDLFLNFKCGGAEPCVLVFGFDLI